MSSGGRFCCGKKGEYPEVLRSKTFFEAKNAELQRVGF